MPNAKRTNPVHTVAFGNKQVRESERVRERQREIKRDREEEREKRKL